MEQRVDEKVIPVISEELETSSRAIPTGGVRVTKRVAGHEEIVEQQLIKERAEVRRVQIGKEVDGPQPVRNEGNTTIVPVVEEVVKVRKAWILKEEIHITKVQQTEPHREAVVVGQEQAIVERLDDKGQYVAEPPVSEPGTGYQERLGRGINSILDRSDRERTENRVRREAGSILKRK